MLRRCTALQANTTVGLDPFDHNENCSVPDQEGRLPVGCQVGNVSWTVPPLTPPCPSPIVCYRNVSDVSPQNPTTALIFQLLLPPPPPRSRAACFALTAAVGGITVCHPELTVSTRAHKKQLGWYVEFGFWVMHGAALRRSAGGTPHPKLGSAPRDSAQRRRSLLPSTIKPPAPAPTPNAHTHTHTHIY